MRTFAATLVITIVITLTGFAVSPAVALADTPAPYQVFLPMMSVAPTPTPAPTPLPPTTPVTGTVQTLWPVRVVAANSQGEDYAALFNKTTVNGGDSLLLDQPGQIVYSLIIGNHTSFGYPWYRISRNYVEFDTTTVPADFEIAQFNLATSAFPGPPAHDVAVHRGTWADGGLTVIEEYGDFLNWLDYDPTLLAILPGNAGAWTPISVTLPREVINPGGITKLVFRSTAEGTPPLTQLGGSFRGLSLTVK